MMRYTGIHHLAMITNDMDKTIRFWRDLLGMRMLAATGDGRNRQYFFEICENCTISFFQWPESVNPEKKHHGQPTDRPLCFDHLAIGLEDDAAMEQMRKKLTAAGFKVSHIVDHGYFKSLYSFDPNGIPIEFTVDVPGRSLREVPRMSDRNLGDVAREGHDPQAGHWPDDGAL